MSLNALLDICYLGGVVGLLLGSRWLMSMSTPAQDWATAQRLVVKGSRAIRRLTSRARVAVLQWVGYTDVRWLVLRRRWRGKAAYE